MMMRSMTKVMMTTLVGLVMFGAGTVQAAPDAASRQGQGLGAQLCKRLACTEAQKAELKKIREQTGPKIKAEREAIRRLRGQIAGEYRKDRLDNAKLGALYSQLDTREGTLAVLRRGALAQIHAILTPAQREQLVTKIEQRRHRGGKRG